MTTETAAPDSPTKKERTFFGQPFSLVHVFGVEMWERFSFYGMQGILLLYMFYSAAEGGLGIPKPVAVGIIGAYGGSVYLATILGAWIADRLLGSERTLFYSAIVVMAGHIALSLLPGLLGLGAGLVLIALGSGGVKANATSVVGTLYAEKDPKRDAGFSIFYLGINLGAFLGPLLTGLLQSTVGFHWGFGAAAVGMAIGLVQYSFGRRSLPAHAKEVPNPLPANRRILIAVVAVAAVVVIVAAVLVGLLTADNLADAVALVTLVASIALFAVILSSKKIDGTERKRVISFIPMFLTSVAFWSLYQQQFTVVTIYANDRLNLSLFGWQMPVAWVQSINPIFIIILSGVFAAIWTKLGDRQPPTPYKFAAAAVVMGIAFLLFIPFSGTGAHGTPLLALVGILFVFTIAELLLSPVGLSLSTKLAPRVFQTQMVALFFLSIALGTALSGILAGFYDENDEPPYFGISGIVAIVVGVVLILLTPWVRKLMQGVR
ncbi:oligopeptide:H+ symporter [Herbiconiux sp. KACC 21604]|uniref:peptide MFS transporter n=1 Tax=unclassified Herbiconiux TaxID=2618217 RepID=UPI0014910BF8|nr:oligopeptide:H+ symporter [Herbiconiux sp. SALV-R1]QJU53521.1 MFS transporter [Herbiconiux sp. SALV-R1]WPO88500.1 oligopeptide:H+ symporter [Herbiconiux sp. KACC 21604]